MKKPIFPYDKISNVDNVRTTRKAVLNRDNAILVDLEQLKIEARNRGDEPTAQKLDTVIFRLLCLTN